MRGNSYPLIVRCCWVLFMFPAGSAMGQASFQGLGDLSGGAYNSKAYGVSGDGTVVVGESVSSWGTEAFRWTTATEMVGLGDLSGGTYASTARGISGDGSTIVGWGNVAEGKQAFRWTEASEMVGLGELPGGSYLSQAQGVSFDGSVIVGASTSDVAQMPFRWADPGPMVGLGLPAGAISGGANGVSGDGIVVVGTWNRSAQGFEAFQWTEAGGALGLGDLYVPNDGWSVWSGANDVSANGSVVVGFAINEEYSGTEAFRRSGSTMSGLGDLPGSSIESQAFGVSDDGTVVVGYGRVEPTAFEAFVWDNLHGMRSVKDVLVDEYGLDLSGWSLERANAVSGDGKTIVGSGNGPSGPEGWVARLGGTPVPGDCDGDNLVDLVDYVCLHSCMTPPTPAGLDTACAVFDFDTDDDVDLADVGEFVDLLSASP